ncbi:hypothetical protein ATANTOWER_032318 [Ataeniobius toweri]|uniref:Uncharacterized protein n=1 Tax=Ataeniobius toweri TaxID=208326 RepID=A0ABU7B4H0_9TELE|nr:hypothetical protein [Ataeniobius toweri]
MKGVEPSRKRHWGLRGTVTSVQARPQDSAVAGVFCLYHEEPGMFVGRCATPLQRPKLLITIPPRNF